ncbi:DUF2461 domain-containing protein [Yersinia massiliensis]|uniref:DUF2461 domain-containing protein n=1 Tax=Yersinia massiliensis TaxID=419257 RepID=UPI0012E07B58|nr:DUF2461 domain-containing protein [Yersinia massiliensis]
MMAGFTGFTQQGLTFLQQIAQNNTKEWFEEHRDIYEQHLLLPMRKLVTDLGTDMMAIDELFEIRPAIGKTISRMNRDTRFSHDKSLYRSNIWLTFKRSRKNWTDAPTYFFEFGPDWWRYGLGYYSASRATMDLFRQQLIRAPADFLKIAECIHPNFLIEGESYKRPLIKDQPQELATWYNKKSWALISHHHDMEPLFSNQLVDILSKDFRRLSPIYDFLMKIEGLKKSHNNFVS